MRIANLQKNIFILLLLLMPWLVSDLMASSYNDIDTKWEYEQKAKILKYLIGKIVWPKEVTENSTFNICVLGDLDYPKPIESMNGQIVEKFKLVVSKSDSIKKLSNHCQIIYVAKPEVDQIEKLIATFSNKPVLLLGDMDNFAIKGGDMNFIVAKETVALTINTEALRQTNLLFDMKGYKITVVPQENDMGK